MSQGPLAPSHDFSAVATSLAPVSPVSEPQATGSSGASAGAAHDTRRVLHLVNGEHYAGAERVQDLLALALPGFGYEVHFVTLKHGSFAETRRSRLAKLDELPMQSRFDLRPLRAIRRLIRTGQVDLIHSHTPRTALLARWATFGANIPWVHHVHSPALADSLRRGANLRNAALERFTLRAADHLIAVSGSLGHYVHERNLARRGLTVVRNGVPVLGPLAPRATPRDGWTLGAVALFRPRKGLEVLLEALARLIEQGFPVRLRAIGRFESPDYEREILALAERLSLDGHVDWVGFASQVNAEFARVDALVLPSLCGEGLPMVVLEAMAAGVPVIASRVEGVPEAIAEGEQGLLVPPGDACALAQTLTRLVNGEYDWQQLRRAAHERQQAEFSDQSMARQVAAIYDQLLANVGARQQ